MALIDLWKRSRDELAGKRLAQILTLAGSGKLRDDNDSSHEFRHLLSNVPTDLLVHYADECLTDKFEDSGLALQDIVNQLGKRLGFSTTEGRYRGTSSQIGFDGIWRSPQGHSLIVEVKTTDAYRIDLDVIAGYRRALISEDKVSEEQSSMLIVVGRQDTGDLEAQIRGSKHAWDVRLISLDALCRLVRVKEEIEEPSTVGKVYDVLMPREFTRVDGIIDLVFSTAEEAHEVGEPEGEVDSQRPKFTPVSFHEACINRIQAHLQISLIRQSKATYLNPDESVVIVCAVSREHSAARGSFYWFAFHPHQRDVLSQASKAYVAFGCGSEAAIVLVPFADFQTWLDGLNVTQKDDRMYWHVHIRRDKYGVFLDRRKGFDKVNLAPFLLPASATA